MHACTNAVMNPIGNLYYFYTLSGNFILLIQEKIRAGPRVWVKIVETPNPLNTVVDGHI